MIELQTTTKKYSTTFNKNLSRAATSNRSLHLENEIDTQKFLLKTEKKFETQIMIGNHTNTHF
jgi:hypothetical protein